VQIADEISKASNKVEVNIIDINENPEYIDRYKVKSVPLNVIDDELFFTGLVSASDLVKKIIMRESPEYEAEMFKVLIEEGRFLEAAKKIINNNAGIYFMNLWENSTMSLRIPLLLASEEVLDISKNALDSIVSDLINLLDSTDSSIRGDTLDLLGRIGNIQAIPKIESIVNDPNPDVAEIAAEVLEELKDAN